MSSSHPNYMEDVPVKISERYKRPPEPSALPQSVSHRIGQLLSVTADTAKKSPAYDFSLENNVLRNMAEWKTTRERVHEAYRERCLARDNERHAKAEEAQKRMLTEVSYPSTDDLSSSSGGCDDIVNRDVDDLDLDVRPSTDTPLYNPHSTPAGHFSPQNCFDTILMPTIAVPATDNNSTESSINRHTTSNVTSSIVPAPKTYHLSKINYSDFENDTSSPFDNLELNSINDLDILAEVLNTSAKIHSKEDRDTTQVNATDCPAPQEQSCENNAMPVNSSATNYYGLPSYGPGTTAYTTSDYSANINSGIMVSAADNAINHNLMYTPSPTIYNSGMGYSSNTVQHSFAPLASVGNNYPTAAATLQQNGTMENFYYPTSGYAPMYNNYRNQSIVSPPYRSPVIQTILDCKAQSSKSKSVPDILHELNADLKESQKRRQRNNSQSTCNDNGNVMTTEMSGSLLSRPKRDDPTYTKLSESAQKLATNISSMGFPIDRVSRVTQRFAGDDKKIVEHLIVLSELLDLGFDESKISEALIQFDNNKDKALDYLIS